MLNLGYPLGQRTNPGPAILMNLGWNIMLVGLGLWIFLDWRYFVAGVILGFGNMVAGGVWLGYRLGKDKDDDS